MANKLLKDMNEMTDRYRGSYISRISPKDEKIPVLVDNFVRSRGLISVVEGDNVYPITEIDINLPKLGAFNIGKSVRYIESSPRRQWKRGVVFDNLSITSAFRPEEDHCDLRRPSKLGILKAIFKGHYPSFDTCLKEVRECKVLSKAFSPKYYLGVKEGHSDICVFYKHWIIGWIDGDSNKIILKAPHLYEELSTITDVEKIK